MNPTWMKMIAPSPAWPYHEDVEGLEALGLDLVIHLQAGAGESLAEHTVLKHRKRTGAAG